VGGLRAIGNMPGVVITAAASRNGPGIGLLISSSGSNLAWQAPGSSTPGPAINVSGGGAFMLEDGADPSMWINIYVYPAYLLGTAQATIAFEDSYNNVGPADVTAANALAGVATTTEYALCNSTAAVITSALMWIDDTASGYAELSISLDGTNFYTPYSSTDTHVLSWPSIAAGASVNVWVKRTIAAASGYAPSILNVLQWQWNGL
jgi:hypothetical protein